jgi:hypothetical protein
MDLTIENRGRRHEIVAPRLGAVLAGRKAALMGGQFAVIDVPMKPKGSAFWLSPLSQRPRCVHKHLVGGPDNASLRDRPAS